MKTKRLSDYSLKTLSRMLRDTEQTLGPDCGTAAVIRRTIDHKQWLASLPRVLREILADATDPDDTTGADDLRVLPELAQNEKGQRR